MNSKKTKILLLTPYFIPDYAAGSTAYAAMAEDLARMDYAVTVLTGMPYYGREKVWEEYASRFFVREEQAGYQVIRVYSYAPRRTNVPGRLLSWTLYNLLAALVGVALERHAVLFVMNPFTMAGLPLLLLSWLKHSHVIYSVEDVYPDALVRAGLITHRFGISVVRALEGMCCRRASLIRVISEGMRQTLISRGINPAKIVTVPYFADTEFIRPLPSQTKFRMQHGLEGKFVVLYAGNMGLIHGVDVVVKAAACLVDHPDIAFLIVGEGIESHKTRRIAEDLRLENVRFFPLQPMEEFPDVLASADVSLVTLKKEFSYESVPSKVYSILASGRPMIASASPGTEIASLVEKSGAGICVDPGSPAALAQAILSLRDDENLRELMGKRGREFVVRHYSRQAVSTKFHVLLQSLLSTQQPPHPELQAGLIELDSVCMTSQSGGPLPTTVNSKTEA